MSRTYLLRHRKAIYSSKDSLLRIVSRPRGEWAAQRRNKDLDTHGYDRGPRLGENGKVYIADHFDPWSDICRGSGEAMLQLIEREGGNA